MGSYRSNRISEEVKRELSNIILNELKDPRIPQLLSITNVKVTGDLRYAKVYVSIYGSDEEKSEAMDGLKSSTGFLKKEIGSRIKLRHVPELVFEIDTSIEYGAHIAEIINKINNELDK